MNASSFYLFSIYPDRSKVKAFGAGAGQFFCAEPDHNVTKDYPKIFEILKASVLCAEPDHNVTKDYPKIFEILKATLSAISGQRSAKGTTRPG